MRDILEYVYIAVAGLFFFISYGAIHYTEFANEKDRKPLEVLVVILYLIASISLGALIFRYWFPD